MKVTLNTEGRFSLTAETEQDNAVLFTITNSKHLNGVQMSFPQAGDDKNIPKRKATQLLNLSNIFHKIKEDKAEVAEQITETIEETVKPKRKYNMTGKYSTRVTKPHKLRKKYMKTCPVEGCNHKGLNLSIHKRMAHGIDKDGEVSMTFMHANRHGGGSREVSVAHPVVKLQDGTYRQLMAGKEDVTNFLADENGAK